jgi:hypothetical protein
LTKKKIQGQDLFHNFGVIRWGFAIGESEHGAARKSIKALAAAGSRFQMQCVLYNPVEKGDRQGNAASLFI